MSLATTTRRSARTAGAFLHLGFSTAAKYPLGFMTQQLAALAPVIIYFFVAKLVDSQGRGVGGDYFSYVILGVIGMNFLNAGLRALSNQLDLAISRGWFEAVLVEPISWRALPFLMAQWPVANALFASLIMGLLGLLLGAAISLSSWWLAAVFVVLGVVAGLAVGVLAGSLKVLAKRGDPILAFYSLLALVFSGVYFPLSTLPSWSRGVSYFIPHTYVISGFRRALMENSRDLGGPSTATSIAALIALNMVLLPLTVWVFGRAMEYGRRLGVLSGY